MASTGWRRGARAPVVLALLGVIVVLAATWWRWSGSGDAVTERGTRLEVGVTEFPPEERQLLPAIAGRTLDGEELDVASFSGGAVVVNVWGSWCGPCRKEAPDLVRVARQTSAWGVHFVGIDTRDNVAAGRAFARRFHVPYPSLDDQDGRILAQFAGIVPISAVPSTIVVDADGRVAARVVGPVDASTLTALLETVRPASATAQDS